MSELRTRFWFLSLLLGAAAAIPAQGHGKHGGGMGGGSMPRSSPGSSFGPKSAPSHSSPAPRPSAPAPSYSPRSSPGPKAAPSPSTPSFPRGGNPGNSSPGGSSRGKFDPGSSSTPSIPGSSRTPSGTGTLPRTWPGTGSSSGSKIRITETGSTPFPGEVPSQPSGSKVVQPRMGTSEAGPGKLTPSAREIYERPGKFAPSSGGAGSGKSFEPIDPRYRGTKVLPTGGTPAGGVASGKAFPTAGVEVPAGGLQPRAGKIGGAPVAVERYAAKPGGKSFGAGVPGKLPPAGGGSANKVARFSSASTAMSGSPRLVPGKPGSKPFASPALLPQSRYVGYGCNQYQWSYGWRSYGYCGGYWNPWYSYWDPCGYTWGSPWAWGGGWYGSGWYWGHGAFACSFSLWYPWWWYRSWYWNTCYADCWWYSSVRPRCVTTGYWWYPATTYCPTYLYVPSTVVVTEDPATVPATAPSSVTVAAPTEEPAAVPAAPSASEPPAVRLARKYIELGDYYFQAGRFREAADAYARARTYAPEDATVHFVLADAAFATGDYQFAAFLISEALRLDPSLATADTDKRLFYGDVRQFEDQLKQLDDYLAAKPNDAQAHLVRGYNLRFSGRTEDAIAAFRKVLELMPDHRAASLFLAALVPPAATEEGKPAIR